MSTNQSREESIFNGALQLPRGQRTAYVQAACSGDANMCGHIQGLLQAHEQDGGPLEAPAAKPAVPTIVVTLPPNEKPGDCIGPYKLLQQIGEGGCGVVYMAEQEKTVRRRVALKVIKLGMDTKQVIARFEAERQALALMDHPNIAKVLDAGATDAGRPFFVMELVRGIKITDYCDQNNLSTNERLKLFVSVCRAIQHAHQKGIIHRDIKPSNILVTLHDGVPVPKVIDFGIAKATDQKLTDKTLFTQFEQFIGTPAYMSPEQAEMSGLDIDTRSDIYSLGVLLYELLTSRTPFDAKELLASGLDAMRRMIREKDPPRPSTRLSTMLMADLTTVARRRQSAAPKLIHLVTGDLDWIAMKALEKDRTRRYDTANGFALDVERYLNNDPIVARPPSQIYRFRKLAQRNRLAVAAVSAVAAALVVGFGLSLWMFVREKQARQLAVREASRSRQVALLLEEMLEGVGPSVARGRDTALLREILDKAVERVAKDLQDQPDVQAELCNTIGEVYRALGKFDKAEAMHRSALSMQSKGRAHPDTENSLNDLALVLRDQGKYPEAEALQREVLALRRKRLGDESADTATTLNNLALVLRSEGRFAEAEDMHRQALATQRKLFGNEHLAVATSLNNLALVLRERGKFAEAEASARAALAIQDKLLGLQHPAVALTLDNLGFVLRDEGKLGESEMLERKALAMQKRFLGEEHKDVATAINNLALVLSRQGNAAEAETLHRQALAMRLRVLGAEHPDVASSLDNLALLLRTQSRPDEADSLEKQALSMRRKLFGDDSLATAGSLNNLGLILRDQGRLADAETSFRDSLAIERKVVGDLHPAVAVIFQHLLETLTQERKVGDAEGLAAEFLPPGRENKAQDAGFLRARGSVRARVGRWIDAAADFSKAIELDPDNIESYNGLAPILVREGNLEAYRRLCDAMLARFGATDNPFTAESLLKNSLILPESGIDSQTIEKLARTASTAGTTNKAARGFQLLTGLADYRLGQFANAVSTTQKLLAGPADAGPRDAEARLLLGLATARLKSGAPATIAPVKAVTIAKSTPNLDNDDLGADWEDILVAQALQREAGGLGEQAKGGGVVQTR